MKTTNYEISKQLAEAKFKANQVWNQEGQFWGYDLETIWNALPVSFTATTGKTYYKTINHFKICYDNNGYSLILSHVTFKEQIKHKSLADAAAKLWLKLKKEGLV